MEEYKQLRNELVSAGLRRAAPKPEQSQELPGSDDHPKNRLASAPAAAVEEAGQEAGRTEKPKRKGRAKKSE